MSATKPPEILDKIVDLVLKYRPKDSRSAKKRAAQEGTLVSDVAKIRKRASKHIKEAKREIEDGALSKKGRFRL
jgi:hypothetical protein